MRPGDLIEFKAGLFGTKPGQNIGIFLERRKRKKEFLLVIHTVRGRQEIKRDHVTGRKFTLTLDPGLDEDQMTARLQATLAEVSEGKLDQGPAAPGSLDERRVWELVVNEITDPVTVDAVAVCFASKSEGPPPTKGDVRRMQDLLERCKRPGVGFFERGPRATWAPIPVASFKAFNRAMEALHRLRKKLVRVEMVEDSSGASWETYVGLAFGDVTLEDDEQEGLGAALRAMSSFVLHDRWIDEVTPPGCPVHTLMGQSFHRFVEWLARDWTGARGVTTSSAMVQMLVDSGTLTTQEAIQLIAQRKVLAAEGLAWQTPDDVEDLAAGFEEPAVQAENDPTTYGRRQDLRALETYTIDPPDAKDFDDAVSIKVHEDGSRTLWVHIADVSHYVSKDGRLDRHARARATSVYLPTGVLPMLPSQLSDNLCSLRERVDRLAMGVQIEVNPDGSVRDYTPYEAVIRVDKNLSYDAVNLSIEEGTQPFASLHALAEDMQRHRKGLAIETGELRIRFAEETAHQVAEATGLAEHQGSRDAEALGDAELDEVPQNQPASAAARRGDHPRATDNAAQPKTEEGQASAQDGASVDPLHTIPGMSVQLKRGTKATKMIETFMVAANEAVSRYVADQELPVPYRCHPLPDRTKVERFQGQARTMGLDVDMTLPEATGPESASTADDLQDPEDDASGPSILDQLKGGKLQLGGFAASETIGSKPEDVEEDDGATERGEDARPMLKGLAQLDPDTREGWLRPFRDALEQSDAMSDEGARDLAFMKVLGTLGRALYTPHNLGHFGLGSTSYAHFTSPIRRYPDLVLHRQLRWALRDRDAADATETPPHAGRFLEELCTHCSQQAEAAERLERQVKDCCMTFASRDPSWSGRLRGTVNGITPGGLFLSLPGELEARLPIRDLPGGPYDVDDHESMLFRTTLPGGGATVAPDPEDEKRLELAWREMLDPATGEVRDVRVRLGDTIAVTITDRDLVEGRVSVRLASAL